MPQTEKENNDPIQPVLTEPPVEVNVNIISKALLFMGFGVMVSLSLMSLIICYLAVTSHFQQSGAESRGLLLEKIELKIETSGYNLHEGVGKEALITSCQKGKPATVNVVPNDPTVNVDMMTVICNTDQESHAATINIMPLATSNTDTKNS